MVDSPSPPLPLILSPCSSGRRSSCDSRSPEFEFWMVRNRIDFPQPNILSADELFSDGFIIPLRLLELSNDPTAPPPQGEPTGDSEENGTDRAPEHGQSTVNELAATSSRWRSIFHKIRDNKGLASSAGDGGNDRSMKEKDSVSGVKEKKRDQKKVNGGGGGGGSSATELNINIWPFSRSRSDGNGANRPRSVANRKVSSAPCSRSNSTGEPRLRKWPPNSPSRGGGVHLGKSSTVWQIRRGGGVGRRADSCPSGEKGAKGDGSENRRKVQVPPSRGRGGSRGRVLSLNVPMCIGYRHNLSCKSHENSSVGIAAAGCVRGGDDSGQVGGAVTGESARRGHLFNIKNLFTKKVY